VDDVQLGRQSLAIRFRREHRLVVEIPAGAASAPFVLVRGGVPVGRSRDAFNVLGWDRGPVVRGFAPPGGPPGTQVTLSGDGFGPEVRVAYGDQALPIVGRQGDDALVVVVPRGAQRSAPFVVATRAGETTSGAWFQLELAGTIDSITPTSGPPGTSIDVRGDGFRGDETFYLGDRPARLLARQPWGVVLEAPAGRGGPLSFDSGGRRVATPFRFDVVAGLAVVSFAPPAGPPGSRVVLRGPGLGEAGQVVYGGLPCAIVRRGRDEVTVEVPPRAAGQDVFWVEAYGQRARSAEAFRVEAPGPAIGAFAPREGRPGTTVVLSASGLGRRVAVWFGTVECPILQRDAQKLVFTIPAGAFGAGPFVIVDDDGRRYATPGRFEVESWW
jgi:hypothetical protein